MTKPTDTSTIVYHPAVKRYAKMPTSSIVPIGLDTEAHRDGRCIMIATSNGDVWRPELMPGCMLDHRHRDKIYVVYNLRYDMGALLQHLPLDILSQLREYDRAEYQGYKYRIIANKMLSISKAHNYVTIYDIMQFYGGSLQYNAEKYLGDSKLSQDVTLYDTEYISSHWHDIARYCIHDATLTRDLCIRLINQCNAWGMHVRKLYSTAWISYAWFSARCGHPTVKHIWQYDRKVLDMAMQSYSGGKFEVTTKGPAHLYEYDIVSAYPNSIANLLDLYHCGIKWSNIYQPDAHYGYIDCTMCIPLSLPSPIAVKYHGINTFPVGTIRKTITIQELRYLMANDVDVTIHNACWIYADKLQYPYRDEIHRLVAIKQSVKDIDSMAYHTVKIIMNSLYGKFVQLTPGKGPYWRAGASWNIIYGSTITAETRVRVSDMQRLYPDIWAVHTDSVISSTPLPYSKSDTLGDMSYETEGDGIIIASGIYQIGAKTALRGLPSKISLRDICDHGGVTVDVSSMQPVSWRQTLQRHYDIDRINRWELSLKRLRCNMDRKRLWLDDWTDWREVPLRKVLSAPMIYDDLIYGG